MVNQLSLDALLESHAEALKIDVQAWEVVSDIYDRPEIQSLPLERVTVGGDYLRMEDGKPVFNPIYLGSAKTIREHLERHLEAELGFLRDTDHVRRQALNERFEAKIKSKICELNAIIDENNKVREDCLYFDALEIAQAAARSVRTIEDLILNYIPKTMMDLAKQADWILLAYTEGERGYLEDREGVLEVILATLSKAGK